MKKVGNRVGLVGWRGMVGSVLMDRMQTENDFARIEPVFFSTSNTGGAAPAMAKFLWTTYLGGENSEPLLPRPERFISSTALRALTTAQIMRETFQMPKEHLHLDQGLYLATEEKLISTVRGFDESWGHAVVFGHNPGMHDFVNRLLARAQVPKFPTCAVAIMALPNEFWALTDWNEAQLVGFLTPKTLERRFPDVYRDISDGDDD